MVDGLPAQLVVPGLVAVDRAEPELGAVSDSHDAASAGPMSTASPDTCADVSGWPPSGRPPLASRTSGPPLGGGAPGTPGNASRCRPRRRPRRLRQSVAAWRSAPRSAGSRLATPGIPSSKTDVPSGMAPPASPERSHGSRREGRCWRCSRRGRGRRRGRRRRQVVAEGCGDRRDDDQQGGDTAPTNPSATGRGSCAVGHAAIEGGAVLPARMWFSICRRYAPALASGHACAAR